MGRPAASAQSRGAPRPSDCGAIAVVADTLCALSVEFLTALGWGLSVTLILQTRSLVSREGETCSEVPWQPAAAET